MMVYIWQKWWYAFEGRVVFFTFFCYSARKFGILKPSISYPARLGLDLGTHSTISVLLKRTPYSWTCPWISQSQQTLVFNQETKSMCLQGRLIHPLELAEKRSVLSLQNVHIMSWRFWSHVHRHASKCGHSPSVPSPMAIWCCQMCFDFQSPAGWSMFSMPTSHKSHTLP